MVILDAVKRADKPSGDLAMDRQRVRDALASTDMKLSQGHIRFGKDGQLNLGHAAFYGVGAYTSALLAMKLGISPWLGLPAGGLAAALLGFLLGFPSLRLSGPYLAITTIGFAEILRLAAINWVDLTRGSLGLSGIPLLTPIRLGSYRFQFYL